MRYFGVLSALIYLSVANADYHGDTRIFTMVNKSDISGFTVVRELPTKHPLRQIGVKKGDIVVAVDLNPIYDFATAEAAYNNREASSATVLRENHKILLRKQK